MTTLPPPSFSVDSSCLSPGLHLVSVVGEVDLHVAPRVAAVLERLEADGADRIVVDLTRVPFLDSSGIGVLLAAAKRLGPSHLTVIAPGAPLRRVLEITGADRVLQVVDQRGDA